MWNKILIFCLILCFCGGVFAANDKKQEKSSKQTKQEKTAKQESSRKEKTPKKEDPKETKKRIRKELEAAAANFNPKEPGLTSEDIERIILTDVYDKMVNKKIPKTFDHIKKAEDTVTYIGAKMLNLKYNNLVKNPELAEVTGIQPKWFADYGAKLQKFEELAKKMDDAISIRNAANYELARAAFEKYQTEVKEFLDQKQPKIPAEELRKLKKKNNLWRVQEFKKYQAEILAKAGMSEADLKKSTTNKEAETLAKAQRKAKTAGVNTSKDTSKDTDRSTASAGSGSGSASVKANTDSTSTKSKSSKNSKTKKRKKKRSTN